MKHTPGPWIALRDSSRHRGDDWMIGRPGKPDEVAVCSERDAALIAAAPDLLDALQDLLGYAAPFTADSVRRARAAIAKAGGE